MTVYNRGYSEKISDNEFIAYRWPAEGDLSVKIIKLSNPKEVQMFYGATAVKAVHFTSEHLATVYRNSVVSVLWDSGQVEFGYRVKKIYIEKYPKLEISSADGNVYKIDVHNVSQVVVA